jgi:hypothetical protein
MPAVLVALWVAPRKARNVVVAAASLLFYAWGAGEFVLMLLACVAVNYSAGRMIGEPGGSRSEWGRRGVLATVIAFDGSAAASTCRPPMRERPVGDVTGFRRAVAVAWTRSPEVRLPSQLVASRELPISPWYLRIRTFRCSSSMIADAKFTSYKV